MNELTNHLYQLKQILRAQDDNYISQAEACLADIAAMDDPSALSELLGLFDDSAPDELMFSIVHTVERWEDSIYCRALLEAVDTLWRAAPRWTQILHIRIMNSPSTLNVYTEMLNSAPKSRQAIVQSIYEEVSKRWPALSDKVRPIIDRLRS